MEPQEHGVGSNGTSASNGEWTEVVGNSAEMQEFMTEFHVNLLGRMAKLEDGQGRLLDYLSDAKMQMAGIVARHEGLLIGSMEKPGLMVRLDRLEILQLRRDRVLVWVATTLFTAIAALALKVFF